MSPDRSYGVGQRVRILDLMKPGHVRTPTYVREKIGIVERYCGTFENPEDRAYGRSATRIGLYRVTLQQSEVWPEYAGEPSDTLEIEIYEHWLAAESGGNDDGE